jgi:hypothetical protein
MGGSARRRPSPSLVISVIALLVALGGTGYAAVAINGKNIENGSIAGKKLRNRTIRGGKLRKDTLTGTAVNESKLGKVPSAGSADSATAAAFASAAGQLFHAENDVARDLPTTTDQAPVLSLTLPPGRYLVTGGGFLNNNGDSADRRICHLGTAAAFDSKLVSTGANTDPTDTSTFWMGLPLKLTTPRQVALSCEGGTVAMTVGGRRILAYRVASITP